MFILGIQGSPRKNGNSRWLLKAFLEACKKYGAQTRTVDACNTDIKPCKELLVCETKGYCPLKDEMEQTIYGLIKRADIIVLASPIYFYNVSAQAKTLIDRCQMFWGRKYKLGLKDPQSFTRQGFLLSVAASGGEKLFDGVHLTAKYFFDAISANYTGSLTYKHIEDAQKIKLHPGIIQDIEKAAKELCAPFLEKKTLLFISKHDACRSQIAGAFARMHTRGKLNIITAGYDAHPRVLGPLISMMMEEKKLDLMYQIPQSTEALNFLQTPDIVINLDSENKPDIIAASEYQDWDIPQPADASPESLKKISDDLESRVVSLLTTITET